MSQIPSNLASEIETHSAGVSTVPGFNNSTVYGLNNRSVHGFNLKQIFMWNKCFGLLEGAMKAKKCGNGCHILVFWTIWISHVTVKYN